MARVRQLSRGRTVPFTPAQETLRNKEELEATRPRTSVEKDATAADQAAQRFADPVVKTLARAAGVSEADLAAEIRLGL